MDEQQQYHERSARHQTRQWTVGAFLAAAGVGVTIGGGLVNLYDDIRVGIARNVSDIAVLSTRHQLTQTALDQLSDSVHGLQTDALDRGRDLSRMAATVEHLRAVLDNRPDAYTKADARADHADLRAELSALENRLSRLEEQ